MNYSIPLSQPIIFKEAKKLLINCVDSNWVSSSGKYVDEFEKNIASFTGSKYAIACSSGSAALQVSLLLAGVNKNDEVIAPSLTFIASVNAISHVGATPVFMDSDDYFNIDVKKTIQFLKYETFMKKGFVYNKKTKQRISAIMPVHVWGNAVDLKNLILECKKRNIQIVEDATESLGTFYSIGSLKGKHTGTIGKLGCISFNGNKILTTGGGGVILTNNKMIARKAKYLTTQAKNNPIKFVHDEIGYNFRLSNLHAAIGISQFKRIKQILEIKRKITYSYCKYLSNTPGLSINESPTYAVNNRWLNILRIDRKYFKKTPEQILNNLKKYKIESRHVWMLNHLQKPYKKYQSYKIENSKKLVETSLCLPSSINLDVKDIEKICNIIKK